jgi:hypothetical protein
MRDLAGIIRGTLRQKAIDARHVTMAAKNASCTRLRAMLMAGTDPHEVATKVFGLTDTSEQSGFALRQGVAFEQAQSRNGAARLLKALQDAGILGDEDVRVLDMANLPGVGRLASLAARRRAMMETDRAIRAKIAGDRSAPNVILQAHLPLPLGDTEHALVKPDIILARTSEAMYRVGEIKSFAALGALTDEGDVGSAAAQSGVYAVALNATLARLGSRLVTPTEAALIFRKPGGFNAEPTLQRIDRDIAVAQRMLDQRPRSLKEIAAVLGHGNALDVATNVLRLKPNFIGPCRSICPLWQVCLNEVRAQGLPATLGRDVEEAIGAVGSTQRARELLAGAQPANDVERGVQRRLIEQRAKLREATS